MMIPFVIKNTALHSPFLLYISDHLNLLSYSIIFITPITFSLWSFRETKSWNGWGNDMESLLSKNRNDLVEFPHTSRPTMNQQQRTYNVCKKMKHEPATKDELHLQENESQGWNDTTNPIINI